MASGVPRVVRIVGKLRSGISLPPTRRNGRIAGLWLEQRSKSVAGPGIAGGIVETSEWTSNTVGSAFALE